MSAAPEQNDTNQPPAKRQKYGTEQQVWNLKDQYLSGYSAAQQAPSFEETFQKFTGALTELFKNGMSEMKNSITDMSTKLAGLETRVSKLDETVANMDKKVNDMKVESEARLEILFVNFSLDSF